MCCSICYLQHLVKHLTAYGGHSSSLSFISLHCVFLTFHSHSPTLWSVFTLLPFILLLLSLSLLLLSYLSHLPLLPLTVLSFTSFPSAVYCFLFSHIHFPSLPLPALLDFHSPFHDRHTQMNTDSIRARWFPTSSRGNTPSVENVTNAKQILY